MILTITTLIVFFFISPALADHVPFLDGMKDASGGSCCGHGNCVAADVTAGHNGEVIINGVRIVMDPRAVHPSPTPDKGWYCYKTYPEECKPPRLEIRKECAMCAFPTPKEGES